jgi:tetratricopeptide (TPR) repeat protein
LPRSEALCLLGDIYSANRDYKKAIYWYKLALQKPNFKSGAFVEQDKYTFIPCINLSVCYYYLGDKKRAIMYNNKALKYKPYDKTALYNKIFYDNIS